MNTVKTFALTITLILTIATSFAQETIVIPDNFSIVENTYPLKGASRNGFQSAIHGEHKVILKRFKSFLKSKYSLKLKSSGTYLKGEDLYNSGLSDKHFSLTIECTTDKLTAWMSLGTDVFVNSTGYSSESLKIQGMMKDFMKSYYTTFLLEEQKANEKAVKKLTKVASKSEKALAKKEKSLTKLKKTIAKTESSLAKNKSKLASLNDKIAGEEKTLSSAKSEKETVEKEITSTEKSSSQEENRLQEAKKRLEAVNTAINKVNGF